MSSTALADPAPFTSATYDCASSDSSLQFPAQATSHADAIFSLTSAGANGETVTGGYNTDSFGPGDVVWGDYGEVQGGTAPQMSVFCSGQGGSVTVQLYDRQNAPTSFSATSTSSNTNSVFPFNAVSTGQYVADVSINQGAILLSSGSYGGSDTTVASSQEVPLGSLSAGPNAVNEQGLDGPPASYTITIRELPVQISGLTFSSTYQPGPKWVAPGTVLTGSFSVSGDTSITAYVRNLAGQVVRHLGSFAVQEGNSAVTWDTCGDGGSRLADGTYYLHLDSTDANGNTTSAETSVNVDGSPPSVKMISRAQITPDQSLSFQVSDAASGVASISLTVDGQDVADYGADSGQSIPANGQISYSDPYNPWGYGTHHWTVQVADNGGNQATYRGSFLVGLPPAPRPPSNPNGPRGGSGALTLAGQVGRLHIDRSNQGDVVAFAGQPDAAGTGNFGAIPNEPNYFAMGYFCGGDANGQTSAVKRGTYCGTVFYLNSRTRRLAAFFTSSWRYSVRGASPGMRERQAQRRIGEPAFTGCWSGFFLGSRHTSTAIIGQVTGGRAHRVRRGFALTGGQLTSILIESRRHSVGLEFC